MIRIPPLDILVGTKITSASSIVLHSSFIRHYRSVAIFRHVTLGL